MPELSPTAEADPGTERSRDSLPAVIVSPRPSAVAWDRADARFGKTLDGSDRLAGTAAYLKLRREPDTRLTYCAAGAEQH